MGYTIRTTGGQTYWTDDAGYVLARTDGPRGFTYGKGWQIVGASTRHNSRAIIRLADIVAGADFGQGWVHDIDHGTHRVWGGGSRRIKSVAVTPDDDAALKHYAKVVS